MTPNNHQTATEARYERSCQELALARLSQCGPQYEAELLARHYASLATLALELLRVNEYLRQPGHPPALVELRDRLVDDIKRQHLHDFGIPVDWPKPL